MLLIIVRKKIYSGLKSISYHVARIDWYVGVWPAMDCCIFKLERIKLCESRL